MAIKDFDAIVRAERRARISGEEVDVSKIPSRVTFEMARLTDNMAELNSSDGFYKSIELVAMACKPSNPTITADWLLDNTDFETLIEFMNYVLAPVRERAEAEGAKQPDEQKKTT